MTRLLRAAAIVVLAAAFARAETGAAAEAPAPPAERLLPASTQVYFRWDGVDAHRDAYDRVAVGKILHGETGVYVKALLDQIPRQLRAIVPGRELLAGAPPDRVFRLDAAVAAVEPLAGVLARRGIVVGFELEPSNEFAYLVEQLPMLASGKLPAAMPFVPGYQLTMIVPGAAAGGPDGPDARAVLGLVGLSAEAGGGRLTTEVIAGTSVKTASENGVTLAGWCDGPDAILALANRPAKTIVTQAVGKQRRLTDAPLFKQVRGFDRFPTDMRFFADLAAIQPVYRKIMFLAAGDLLKRLDATGITDIRAVTYVSGFEGDVSRSVLAVDWPGPRKGFGRAFAGDALSTDDLPPLPPNATGFAMYRVDPPACYELLLTVLEAQGVLGDANAVTSRGKPRETAAEQVDRLLNMNVRDDILQHLGTRVVLYHTPGEGPAFIGQAAMIEVKSPRRLAEGLEHLTQELVQTSGGTLALKRRPCLANTVYEMTRSGRTGFPFAPSFAIADRWMGLGIYPQPVRGFVHRSAKKMPSWTPDPRAADAFRRLATDTPASRAKRLGVSVIDLRPSFQQTLGLATFAALAASANDQGTSVFEPGLLPSALAINQHLFPNVTMMSDDGTRIAWEFRGSVPVPFESTGVDMMSSFLLLTVLN